jgi:hypothetical protein
MLFWFLAAPVAILARALATEEIGREAREFCAAQQACCQERRRSSDAGKIRCAADFLLQKLFYMPTCEFCSSFWVSLIVVLIAEYRIHFDDWRGVALACFVVMGLANVYLSVFTQIRVDSRKDRAVAEDLERRRAA